MRKNHKKPNLFIVGSPKCGTTSLYHYLKEHPQICMSKEKELNYAEFSEYNPYIKNLKDYLSQWDHIKDEKIIGEATPTYSYSKKSAEAIYNFNPKAKIILMRRNPNEALVSWFRQYFTKNVGLKEPHFEIYNYDKIIPRYEKFFPKEQFMIIEFEDFINNPLKVYKEVLQFLGVEYDGKRDFPIHNEGYDVRNEAIEKLIHKYFHGENWLKSFAKIFISNKTAQKIADLNRKKKK